MNISSAIERRSGSPADTEALGAELGRACQGGELLVLIGELGSGKTVLVRGLARGLGCDVRRVRSPSYTLLHQYPGRRTLHHFDVYFTPAWEDLERSPLREFLAAGGVVAVEWGNRFLQHLPEDRLELQLLHAGGDVRQLRFTAHGPVAARWLAAIEPRSEETR